MPSTYDDWTLYANHREHLTDAILRSAARQGARLCLLGAGECNDVDLSKLSTQFSEIHLVDIDAGALGRAVSRQAPEVRARLRPHPNVDLSGLAQRLRKWKRRPIGVAQVEASATQTLQTVVARLPGPFDVVASACVLTQMSFAVSAELGDAHPALDLVRLSVVATHLNILVELTTPGGAALFASDLTSSSAFPVEELRSATNLRESVDRIVSSGAAYHSAKPDLVRTILASGALGERTGEPELLDPWLWTGRHDRTYFVYALRVRRHSDERRD